MPDESRFKHIKVNAAPERDEVIQAGYVEQHAESEGTAEPAPAADDSSPAAPVARPRKAEDGYRETTLEDLQAEKTSFTQKAVIIAAIALIIVAVVYYFAVMR